MPTAGLRNVVDRLRHAAARKHVGCGELLDRFVAARDEDAFAELVRRHGPRVYAVCRRVLGQHQLAEDAFQAVFVVLARKAHAVRPRSAVGGFLYGVARKAALEAYAVSRRRRKETLAARVPETPAATSTAVEADALALLDEEIANLSDPLRAAVVLCELDGVSRADAARQLGIAEGTLSSRLAAARKQLAARLAKRGVTLSAALFAAVAQSAAAAPPVVLAAALPPTVAAIAAGVMRTMILAKLKTAATVGVLLVALAAWSLAPATAPSAAAAPVPRDTPDDGLLWVHEKKANRLVAYKPTLEVAATLDLPGDQTFLGLTPDGGKIVYAAGDKYHVRDFGRDTPGTDLGFDYSVWDQPPVWNQAGTAFVRGRNDRAEMGGVRHTVFEYTRFDVAEKRATALKIPSDHWVQCWAPEGNGYVTLSLRDKEANLLHTTDGFAEPKPLPSTGGRVHPHRVAVSPDGRTLLIGGFTQTPPKEPWHQAVWTMDLATGTVKQIVHEDGQGRTEGCWSPDGKRIAMLWGYQRDAKQSDGWDQMRLSVARPDGGDRTTIALRDKAKGEDTYDDELLGWFPTRHTIVAVPKAKGDEGLVWVYFPKTTTTATLTAYRPDGRTEQEVTIPYADRYLGPTPDGRKIAFMGKSGKLAESPTTDGLTIHLRDIDDGTDGTDTGIPAGNGVSYPVWSPDMKQVAYARITHKASEFGGKVARYKYAVVDLSTRKETPLALPDDHVVIRWSPDGTWLLVAQGNHSAPWKQYTLADDKLRTIVDEENYYSMDASPDGKKLIGFGPVPKTRGVVGKKEEWGLHQFDVATGTPTRADKFRHTPEDNLLIAKWSLDGNRVACAVREKKVDGQESVRVIVCDPDGGNEVQLTRSRGQFMGMIHWLPAKHTINANPTESRILLWNEGEPILIRPDGTDEVKLPTVPAWRDVRDKYAAKNGFARFSPDGRQLLVRTVGPGFANDRHHLYVRPVFADGTGDRLPLNPENTVAAAWAGGGKVRGPDWEYDVTTKEKRPADRLRHPPLVFSPDGQWQLSMKDDREVGSTADRYRLLLVPPDGTETVLAPALRLYGSHNFAFSPGGKQILFVADHPPWETPEAKFRPTELYTIARDGTQLRRLELKPTHEKMVILSCCWSPDGRQVAAAWVRQSEQGRHTLDLSESYLTVADADGTNAKTIRTAKNRFLGRVDWADVPKPDAHKIAAPLPKAAADEGFLWAFDKKAGTLTAYTPDGAVAKKLPVKSAKHFIGFTPDGAKVVFAGKGGRPAADDEKGLTLHLGDGPADAAGTDTGVPYEGGDQFVLSPDKAKVVRSRVVELEIVDDKRYHVFENRLFDLTAKTDAKLELPKDAQVMRWTADGRAWWILQNNVGRDPKLPNYRWLSVPVAGGRPTPFDDDYSLMWMEPSPDGKTVLATGWNHPFPGAGLKWFHRTPATGKTVEVTKFDKVAFVTPRWSPDGTRVAYGRYDYDPETGKVNDTTLFVCRPDRTDEKRVAHFADDNQNTLFLGWFPEPKKVGALPPADVKTAFLKAAGDSAAAVALFDRIAADPHRLAVLTEAVQNPRRAGDLYAAELWRVWRAAASPTAPEGGVPAADAAVCFFLGGDPATADALKAYPEPADATEGFRTHETLVLSTSVNHELFAKDRQEPFGRLIAAWAAARSDPWVRGSALETARTYRLAAMLPVVRRLAVDAKAEPRFRLAAVTLLADLGGKAERDVLVKLLADKAECDTRTLTIRGEAAPTVTRQIRDVALGCLLVLHGAKIADAGFDEFDYWKPSYTKPAEYFRLAPFGFIDDDNRARAHAKAAAVLKVDRDRLQGRWKLVESNDSGGIARANGFTRNVLTFAGDSLTVSHDPDDDPAPARPFKLDEAATPKRIDFQTEGKKNPVDRLGIYKLEGDTLTVCSSTTVPVRPELRPTDFTISETNGRLLSVYERLKDDDPRWVAGWYAAKALAGKPDDAIELAVKDQSPAEKATAEELKATLAAAAVTFPTAWADAKEAIVVSADVKLAQAQPDGRKTGRLVFTLAKAKAGWRVKDIDVRTAAKADEAAAAFRKKHPTATEVKASDKP